MKRPVSEVKRSKQLVIDADVARAVSKDGKGAAVPCHDFLA